jgi:hypothetical protein
MIRREAKKLNVRFFGFVSLVYVFLSLLLAALFERLSGGAQSVGNLGPILSLEFAGSIERISEITDNFRAETVGRLEWALIADSFVFVPLYTGFLLFFAQLLYHRRSGWIIGKSGWYKKANIANPAETDREDQISKAKEKLLNFSFLKFTVRAVSVFIVAAGAADLVENYFTYDVLENAFAADRWKIGVISAAACVKWFLIASTVAVFSLIFLPAKRFVDDFHAHFFDRGGRRFRRAFRSRMVQDLPFIAINRARGARRFVYNFR